MNPQAKVLVIDDDPAILDALQFCLAQAGHFVLAAPSPQNILQDIQEFRPDLILMDVLLSGAEGREVCQTLKGNEQTKHIPVILISAHPDVADSARNAGAVAFIAKPFDFDHLLQEIQKYIPRKAQP